MYTGHDVSAPVNILASGINDSRFAATDRPTGTTRSPSSGWDNSRDEPPG
jgi:hypothetical protein